jgi:SAM-dependent methyltransferase
MSARAIPPDHARRAYDVFAGFYDDFTADHDYERWVGMVAGLVQAIGAPGLVLLDVACGTGSSFEPLLARGYTITATDVSPAMVAEARRKAGDRIDVQVHDMRALPALGRFDVVWCLGEAVNYLHTRDELVAAFASARRNLRDGGLFVFDTAALGAFRSIFSSLLVIPGDDRVLVLDGKGSPDVAEGGASEVWIDRMIRDGDGCWRREQSVHHHRHHPQDAIRRALERSGFELTAVRGSTPGEPLHAVADDLRHTKLVFAARQVRASDAGR